MIAPLLIVLMVALASGSLDVVVDPVTSQGGIGLIKRYESLRLEVYNDIGGQPTIGYGHSGYATGKGVITEEGALKLLVGDVAHAEKYVKYLVDVPLTQNQFDALVSFTFNVGVDAFRKSTLLKLLNEGKYALASDQFLRWVHVDKVQVSGLVRRRIEERALFNKKET